MSPNIPASLVNNKASYMFLLHGFIEWCTVHFDNRALWACSMAGTALGSVHYFTLFDQQRLWAPGNMMESLNCKAMI